MMHPGGASHSPESCNVCPECLRSCARNSMGQSRDAPTPPPAKEINYPHQVRTLAPLLQLPVTPCYTPQYCQCVVATWAPRQKTL